MTTTEDPHSAPMGEELTDRIGKINDEIEKFEVRIDGWGEDKDGRFSELGRELADDRDVVVAATKRIGEVARDEWHQAADRARHSLEQLERELETAWADLEVELAEDVDAYKAATRRQIDSWRGYVELARLRASLAGMEARDAVAKLDSAYEAARPQLDQAWAAADEAFAGLRDRARTAVVHLRDAARDAMKSLS